MQPRPAHDDVRQYPSPDHESDLGNGGDEQQLARAGDDRDPGRAGPADHEVVVIDAVHVRNYDHRRSHSVTVVVDSPAGDRLLSDRFSLAPGQSDRSRAPLPAGEYDLRVDVDGVERAQAACRLGPSPSGTAVVELGNGAVSVTPGADDRGSAE